MVLKIQTLTGLVIIFTTDLMPALEHSRYSAEGENLSAPHVIKEACPQFTGKPLVSDGDPPLTISHPVTSRHY
jgi:hypothetical protein